jgi:hypothetical protein
MVHLKKNWKPNTTILCPDRSPRSFSLVTNLEALLEAEILVLDGQVIDANVHVGGAPPYMST